MSALEEILSNILPLKSTDKLILVDKILASIQPTNIGVETIWGNEAEERISAYSKGHVTAVDEKDVFTKYEK